MPIDGRAIQKAMAEEYERETGEKWCEPPLICDMDGVLTDFVGDFVEFALITADECNPSAFFGIAEGDATTNAAPCSGNNGGTTGETT
jgi:hypothetical protein